MDAGVAEVRHVVIAARLIHEAGQLKVQLLGILGAAIALGGFGLRPQRMVHTRLRADVRGWNLAVRRGRGDGREARRCHVANHECGVHRFAGLHGRLGNVAHVAVNRFDGIPLLVVEGHALANHQKRRAGGHLGFANLGERLREPDAARCQRHVFGYHHVLRSGQGRIEIDERDGHPTHGTLRGLDREPAEFLAIDDDFDAALERAGFRELVAGSGANEDFGIGDGAEVG